ncbi:MAG: ABC transporter ATP-binding protein [Alphaproteobacteria bacterium]
MTAAPVFRTERLSAGYGGKPVLNGIEMELRADEVLCLIGHNGAGKSTLLKTLYGLVVRQGGRIFLDGKEIAAPTPRAMTAAGVSLVPEGRGVFPGLTVAEIFAMGMWAAGVPARERAERVEWVMAALPQIRVFYRRRAGLLSGGQQQMVSIGRALLNRPRCLLMDEPSIGLAPKLFQDLLEPIKTLQERLGMAILLVEQNVRAALKISHRVLVMKAGVVILEAKPEEIGDNARLIELY